MHAHCQVENPIFVKRMLLEPYLFTNSPWIIAGGNNYYMALFLKLEFHLKLIFYSQLNGILHWNETKIFQAHFPRKICLNPKTIGLWRLSFYKLNLKLKIFWDEWNHLHLKLNEIAHLLSLILYSLQLITSLLLEMMLNRFTCSHSFFAIDLFICNPSFISSIPTLE